MGPLDLVAPFPYFGGKRAAAAHVWAALGPVDNYVEPFFGSGAALLLRPGKPRVETVNDADGLLANVWRAMRADPEAVAHHADWPVNEADLHARHRWLIGQRETLTEQLVADPELFDAKVAGWWVWGLCAWIGTGWCEKESKRIPFFGNTGMGVHSATGADWTALSRRLAGVDVACGDWQRVVSSTVLFRTSGVTGCFVDPPYAEGAQQYAAGGTGTDLSARVRSWCGENGSNPRLRIVLCGYDGEHNDLEASGWRRVEWNAQGAGYVGKGAERDNQRRERLWLSPHCEGGKQRSLFDVMGGSR